MSNNQISNIRTQLRDVQRQLKRAKPDRRQELLRQSRDLNLALSHLTRGRND